MLCKILQHSEEEDDGSGEAEAVCGEVKVEGEAPVLGLDLGGQVEPHAAVRQLQQHDGEHAHPQGHAQAAGAGAGLRHRDRGDDCYRIVRQALIYQYLLLN